MEQPNPGPDQAQAVSSREMLLIISNLAATRLLLNGGQPDIEVVAVDDISPASGVGGKVYQQRVAHRGWSLERGQERPSAGEAGILQGVVLTTEGDLVQVDCFEQLYGVAMTSKTTEAQAVIPESSTALEMLVGPDMSAAEASQSVERDDSLNIKIATLLSAFGLED